MKTLTKIFVGFNIFFTFYFIYENIAIREYDKSLLAILIVGFLLIPSIFEKLSKIKIKEYIKTIYYFFILISVNLGILESLYYITVYFDRVVHFLFGVLFSIILFDYIKDKTWRKILYIIAITLMFAILWEFGEFFSDLILKTDHQHKVGGATDTMMDLLMAFIGSIATAISIKIMYKIRG